MDNNILSNIQIMRNWIFSYQISKAIFAATQLGIADALESGSHSIEQLSHKLNCHPESLYRLLRALTSIGIFQETEDNVFAQNELSQLLSTHDINTLNPATLFYCSEQYDAWGHLAHSIQTGENTFSRQNHKEQTC